MSAAGSARFLVAAAHRSSGKTTLALGLSAALRARGYAVQTFKKGPDYIDPMWLALASGRPCYNLDPFLTSMAEARALFGERMRAAQIGVVEGNQSLHDGMALDGSDSNAALAAALGIPVILVLDAHGVGRGVAPLVLGYQAFDRSVRIGGVILNRVGGARHEAKLRAVLEHYTDIPVLGAVRSDPEIGLLERHLGLVTTSEVDGVQDRVRDIAQRIAQQVDLDALLAAVGGAPPLPGATRAAPDAGKGAAAAVRIGIAMDRAFGFYYADDLDALRQAGAQIVPFDTLRDPCLPRVDGIVIGGGFPESCAAGLEANAGMRASIAEAVQQNLPVYAECGGLMYLARSLTVEGRSYRMVGAIAGDVRMQRRPVGKGYVELETTGTAPFPLAAPARRLRAHEFHYSSLDGLPEDATYAYRVKRGHGIDGHNDGIVVRNLVASYSHLRSLAGTGWAPSFVAFAARCRGMH